MYKWQNDDSNSWCYVRKVQVKKGASEDDLISHVQECSLYIDLDDSWTDIKQILTRNGGTIKKEHKEWKVSIAQLWRTEFAY